MANLLVFSGSNRFGSDFFGPSQPRKLPTAEKALEIQEWLKTKPEAKKRKPKTE